MKTVYCILLFFFLCIVGYAQQKTFCQLTCSMPAGMEEETGGYGRESAGLAVSRQMDRSGENVCLLAEEAVLKTPAGQIFRTLPCLQTLTDCGITVSWLTRVPVYSWVEYGTDTLELKKARTMLDGQTVCNNHIHKIRLEDLEAGKTYYYRVCSREILAYEAYSKTFGNTAVSPFYSFRVPGERETDFTALIFNDIHQEFPTMAALCKQIEGIDYDFVIFNGDMLDAPGCEEEVVEAFSFYQGQVRAEEKPVFYLRGNHEIRNAYSLHLRRLLYYMGDKTYGAFNWGDTRFVLLDCGEDKMDDHWVYYGLNDFSRFRDEQTEFLQRELRSKAFRQSGKKVLVHHIPLWGNETDYTPCRELWGGLLKKGPVDISLNAHTHIYAFHPAGSLGNPFPVVVGGGYELDKATVMVLTRKGDTLRLKVLNTKGQVLQELEL